MNGIQMLHGRILVLPNPPEEKSEYGLHVVQLSEPNVDSGTVMAVGPGKLNADGERIPLSIKEGDKIRFTTYGYDEVMVDGVNYFVMEEQYVIGTY